MGSLARLLGRIEAVFEYIAIGLLATMMLLVSMDAAGRYLFLSPILGTHEFVETYLMVGVVWLGMAQIQAAGGRTQRVAVLGEDHRLLPGERTAEQRHHGLQLRVTAWCDLLRSKRRRGL